MNKLSAYDFSSKETHPLGFSCGAKETAAILRAFADRVEKQEVLLQRIQVTSEVSNSEWATSAMVIDYCEADTIKDYISKKDSSL